MPIRSLKWHVWSSSSGNDCHAVKRSLSSGASVYESIMVFFSLSHFVSQFPPTRFPLLTAIRMCHFLPVHHLEWHFWPGRRSKYNTCRTSNTHLKQFTSLACSVVRTYIPSFAWLADYKIRWRGRDCKEGWQKMTLWAHNLKFKHWEVRHTDLWQNYCVQFSSRYFTTKHLFLGMTLLGTHKGRS